MLHTVERQNQFTRKFQKALIPTLSLILRQNTALFEMGRRVWNSSADFRSFLIIFLDEVFTQLHFSVGLIVAGRGG